MSWEKAWSKIDTAAAQFPIAEARRLGTVAPSDFAAARLTGHLGGLSRCGLSRCGLSRCGLADSYFSLFGRRQRLDSDLIF